MWFKINPKQKTCLPRGPGGLQVARVGTLNDFTPGTWGKWGATFDPHLCVSLPLGRDIKQ